MYVSYISNRSYLQVTYKFLNVMCFCPNRRHSGLYFSEKIVLVEVRFTAACAFFASACSNPQKKGVRERECERDGVWERGDLREKV